MRETNKPDIQKLQNLADKVADRIRRKLDSIDQFPTPYQYEKLSKKLRNDGSKIK